MYVSLFNKLLNTIENINVYVFVFFHPKLTVGQNTRMSFVLNT